MRNLIGIPFAIAIGFFGNAAHAQDRTCDDPRMVYVDAANACVFNLRVVNTEEATAAGAPADRTDDPKCKSNTRGGYDVPVHGRFPGEIGVAHVKCGVRHQAQQEEE